MVIQTTVFICEKCGRIESITSRESVYSDPVISYPEGQEWDFITVDGKELEVCPTCINLYGS